MRTAADYLPPSAKTIAGHARAAQGCRGCPLWRRATQAVFGEGAGRARIMLVGEQPGDQEDKQGHPFVGPAGRVLDDALETVGLDKGDLYITNIVKHFKWKPQGKRRIHVTPSRIESEACRPWFDRELQIVRPRALVVLGSVAAKVLFGPSFRVTAERGVPLSSDLAPLVFATVHPSSILRAPDDEREEARLHFVKDLAAVVVALGK